MVANSKEKHGGQIMGGTVTIDIHANDKGRVWVDVAWKQESVNDPRHYVGI